MVEFCKRCNRCNTFHVFHQMVHLMPVLALLPCMFSVQCGSNGDDVGLCLRDTSGVLLL